MCKLFWLLLCLLSGGEYLGVRGLLWNHWLASWGYEVLLLQRSGDCFHNCLGKLFVIKPRNNICGCMICCICGGPTSSIPP